MIRAGQAAAALLSYIYSDFGFKLYYVKYII